MSVKLCVKCKVGNGPRALSCKACGHSFSKDNKPKMGVVNTKTESNRPTTLPGTLEYNASILRAASLAIEFKHSSYEDLVKDIAHGWLGKYELNPADVAKTLKRPISDLFTEVEAEQVE